MSDLTLAQLDRDEALGDAIAQLHGSTRAELIRGAAVGGAALLGLLAAPPAADAQIDDRAILNFGLRFERLQASFYTGAEELGTIGRMEARKQEWAKTLGAHERAHVRILKQVLGDDAEARPFFDFRGANETDERFTRTAVAMEDLTVALLTGVTPRVRDRSLTAALFGLLTVEARHAAWARHIVGSNPSPRAFDEPRTLASVRGVIARTRFVAQRPSTSRRRRPSFTG
jgi:hypothetical protein